MKSFQTPGATYAPHFLVKFTLRKYLLPGVMENMLGKLTFFVAPPIVTSAEKEPVFCPPVSAFMNNGCDTCIGAAVGIKKLTFSPVERLVLFWILPFANKTVPFV
ncbi:MAG: hypothetical protein PQ275_29180 [Elizabethkingia anophelis]|nr:MAG: hypothetical protein PQ275_29180 [Elizabethkingia anophelis]